MPSRRRRTRPVVPRHPGATRRRAPATAHPECAPRACAPCRRACPGRVPGEYERGYGDLPEARRRVHAAHGRAAADIALRIRRDEALAEAGHRGGMGGAERRVDVARHDGVRDRLDALFAHGRDALFPHGARRVRIPRRRMRQHECADQCRTAQRQLLADHAAHRQADPYDRARVEFAQQACRVVRQCRGLLSGADATAVRAAAAPAPARPGAAPAGIPPPCVPASPASRARPRSAPPARDRTRRAPARRSSASPVPVPRR